ncbi:MAG: peptidylprolyl isomerase [Saprospiraceae bacterium]|nr:peptidylprolyl isomerase [Saprospiraceae bacterium]
MRWSLFLFLFLASFSPVMQAQVQDPVLFTVEGVPVHVSEFDYIYKKTNGNNADYSTASIQEYLDLYIKFKLKVQKAKEMELDTIASLSRELEGYRRQLADSYLVDKEVTDKMIEDVYKRMLSEREVAHILFKIKPNATNQDSTVAIARAQRAIDALKTGSDFAKIARGSSEDPTVETNGGNLGYLTAMLPEGFYAFENAIYNTPVGQVSEIVFSPMGVHVLKVLSERPARGEIEVAHILIRDPENMPIEGAAQKAQKAYDLLKAGGNFEEVALDMSDDKLTSSKGGYLGFFGINKYEKAFEDAAFALTKNGDFTKPVKTRIGWHVILRKDQKGIEPLPKIKSRLQNQITQDSRFEMGKKQMIDRIKKDAGFKEDPAALAEYIKTLDQEFLSYKWQANNELPVKTLFTLGTTQHTNLDFNEYLLRNQRKRLQVARDSQVQLTAMLLYNDFVSESCIKFEEAKLEVKYPEFKALMREYEEGILLFEATKMLVWDKASQDTVGLSKFHSANREKYMWDERAEWMMYTLTDVDEKAAKKIYEYAKTKSAEQTQKKFNKKKKVVVTTELRMIEKANATQMTGVEWAAGSISEMKNWVKIQFIISVK